MKKNVQSNPRRAEPNAGRCSLCGRTDVAERGGEKGLGFHYSPEPCGLPCAGGPIGTQEDHTHGVHPTSCACPKEGAPGVP